MHSNDIPKSSLEEETKLQIRLYIEETMDTSDTF